MRKGTSIKDISIIEYASWEDIHKATKWPVKLLFNRYHKISIFNSRISSFTVRTHTRKCSLKQYMLKKPPCSPAGCLIHRWFRYKRINNANQVVIDNDIFRN